MEPVEIDNMIVRRHDRSIDSPHEAQTMFRQFVAFKANIDAFRSGPCRQSGKGLLRFRHFPKPKVPRRFRQSVNRPLRHAFRPLLPCSRPALHRSFRSPAMGSDRKARCAGRKAENRPAAAVPRPLATDLPETGGSLPVKRQTPWAGGGSMAARSDLLAFLIPLTVNRYSIYGIHRDYPSSCTWCVTNHSNHSHRRRRKCIMKHPVNGSSRGVMSPRFLRGAAAGIAALMLAASVQPAAAQFRAPDIAVDEG